MLLRASSWCWCNLVSSGIIYTQYYDVRMVARNNNSSHKLRRHAYFDFRLLVLVCCRFFLKHQTQSPTKFNTLLRGGSLFEPNIFYITYKRIFLFPWIAWNFYISRYFSHIWRKIGKQLLSHQISEYISYSLQKGVQWFRFRMKKCQFMCA